MTFHERATAIAKLGFTERQARFLATVMLHSGVCAPRQYATFCGIVHGQKTRKFFAKLVRLGHASMYDCRHNRAGIYHINGASLYRSIDDAQSRLRRPLTLSHAIRRLMLLDGLVESLEMVWLPTADDQAAHLLTLTSIEREDLPHATVGEGDKRTVKYFPERLPIGIDPEGRGVLVYLVTEPSLDEFRIFLERHAPLLRALRAWALRIVVLGHLPGVGHRTKHVVWEQLLTPLRPPIADELKWFFEHARTYATPSRCKDLDERFFVARDTFSTPRFKALYCGWKQDGERALAHVDSHALADAVEAGSGRVETLDLGHRYGHLSPLVTVA
jgi:hypothetical protein